MSILINPQTSEQRKKLFVEILLNKTNKVSKITDNSVLNATAYGISKVAAKAEKDIFLALSQLFPDLARTSQLDSVAELYSIAERFSAAQSSTYIRLVASPGTQYIQGIHTFISSDGIEFDLEQNITIGNFGFDYAKIRSLDVGEKTNVKSGSITTINSQPTGHKYCFNEYQALYGRDAESDSAFRKRIKESANILARGTIAMLEQAFMKINNNVLRIINQGVNSKGQRKLAIVTQNGIDLNTSEINELLFKSEEFFGLTEIRPFGKKSYGIELVNCEWQPIDISFRCEFFPSANVEESRINIQTKISKSLDFRNFNVLKQKVEWDNLLQICKSDKGVKYVPDEYFFPRTDIKVNLNKLPRLRGFIILNLEGNIVSSFNGNMNPIYYPNVADFSFQQTILKSL